MFSLEANGLSSSSESSSSWSSWSWSSASLREEVDARRFLAELWEEGSGSLKEDDAGDETETLFPGSGTPF